MNPVTAALQRFQDGDLAGAEALLNEILARTPEEADALHMMGGIHHARGDLPNAAIYFERAHLASPYDAEIAFNRAVVLSSLARHRECIEACGAFLKLRPGDPEALLMQGAAFAALGHHQDALAAFDQTYEHRADVHIRRAASLLDMGRTEDALTAAARASGIEPNNPDAHYYRGQAFARLELWREAAEAYDIAVKLAPKRIAIRAARAPALANVGRFDEALADADMALASNPERAGYHGRRAYILSAANRADEALAALDRVLAQEPYNAQTLYAKADLILGGGDFERGLPFYEVRRSLGARKRITRTSEAPLWRGEDLNGKTILVQGEQGFGDLFQFCRFIPELAARGAKVILQERTQTRELMQSLDGLAHFALATEPAPPADYHIPLASLMLALGVRVDTIPAPIPYLHASPERVARWRKTLGPSQRRRIGIVWSGIAKHAMQTWRSLDNAALTQLGRADADFFSLQMEENSAAAAAGVRQFGKDIADFADLAALIETLEAVVSIDTGVAHLAGALGKPVYLMLPFRADWRWLRDRADTPWYPNMRLFRQPRFGDWQSVIAGVHAALQE